MSNQPPSPPPPPSSGMPPPSDSPTGASGADLGIRFGARAIDTILFYIVFIILALVVLVPLVLSSGSSDDPAGVADALGGGGVSAGSIISGLVALVLIFGFFVAFDTTMGGTPGKKILNLTIQGESGGNPTPAESVKRNAWLAFNIIPFIGWLLVLAAGIYIAVTISQSSNNVGWHDTFAGTRVVKS